MEEKQNNGQSAGDASTTFQAVTEVASQAISFKLSNDEKAIFESDRRSSIESMKAGFFLGGSVDRFLK